MIEVTLVTNDGGGVPVKVEVVDDTTLGSFLDVHFDGELEDFTVRVRSNGASVQVFDDYVLQDGDRVSLAPKKVDGAVTS
jgi:hypothetical protein